MENSNNPNPAPLQSPAPLPASNPSNANSHSPPRQHSRSKSRSRSHHRSHSHQRSSNRLYIGHLSRHTRAQDVRDIFGKYGSIRNLDLKSDYGFLEYEDEKGAKDAVDKLHNTELDHHRIVVEPAVPKRKSRGPTGQDVCFNCGLKGHW